MKKRIMVSFIGFFIFIGMFIGSITPLHAEWVERAEKRGFKNARAILDDAIRLGKMYAKTTGRGYQE